MRELTPLTADQQNLVENHIGLVQWTVNRYIHSDENIVGLAFDDLCQEGAIAMIRAVQTYRAGAASFETFAVTVIRNHLLDYCRKISAGISNLPTISLDALAEESGQTGECEGFEDECISRLMSEKILERRKVKYAGSARLGIEALELKVLEGYGVTDIAALYGEKPNLVGAWISKAAKKLREDVTIGELDASSVEKLSLIA